MPSHSSAAKASNRQTSLGPRLTLPNPVLAAAGTFGWGDELTDLADVGKLGALITPTLTLIARDGNPMPRTAETSAGMLHAMGLPNTGLDAFLADRLPALRTLPCPVIVSLLAQTPEEWAQLADAICIAGGPVALELNLTPLPLLAASHAHELLPSEAELHTRIRGAVETVRAAASLPIIAKLPATGVEIGAAARTAAEAGADAIAVSQAFPALAVRAGQRRLRFAGGVAGMSGPGIKPLALYQVWRTAQCVSLPIVGGGGIMTAEDALEFFVAGATAIAVGIASLIHPNTIAGIEEEAAKALSVER